MVAGAVLGADGFGLAMDAGRWIKVPQLGGVVVGDDCEIGANTTIDRGALDDTVLDDGVKLDNLIQVGHNVRIGDHTAVAGCTAIAGSARIGRYCLVGGAVGSGARRRSESARLAPKGAISQESPDTWRSWTVRSAAARSRRASWVSPR